MQAICMKSLVGTTGFEPATPCTPSRCATRLRYVPTKNRVKRILTECAVFNSQSLFDPELLPALGADALRGPRRVPNYVDLRGVDSRRAQDSGLDIAADLGVRRAPLGGERHFDHYVALVLDIDLVDQPEVHHVERDLRIVTVAQLFPDCVGADHQVQF